jgi:hypothetical protein
VSEKRALEGAAAAIAAAQAALRKAADRGAAPKARGDGGCDVQYHFTRRGRCGSACVRVAFAEKQACGP